MNKLFSSYLILAIFLTACSTVKEHTVSQEEFPVTRPIVLDTVYYKEYVAEIHSVQNVEIRNRVRGIIENIYVDEGKPVKAGQTLFKISSQEYREELLKAQAKLNSAKAEAKSAALEIESTHILLEKKIVSESELKRLEAKFEALQARIEEARSEEATANLRLSMAEIKAPFDGTINRIPFKKGSMIDEGTLLTTISDNKEVFAYFNVSEKEYLDFLDQDDAREKIKVDLLLASNKPHKYQGYIETIEGEFNKSTGNIAFRARFPNPDLVLKHGSSGKVRLRSELKGALVIPQKSTFEVQEKLYVFVIDSTNTVKMQSIVPKQRISHLFILESGLTPKDNIIFEGIQKVQEGDFVMPHFISMDQIIAKLSKK